MDKFNGAGSSGTVAVAMSQHGASPDLDSKVKNSDVSKVDIRKLNNAGENFLTESGTYKL